MLNFDLLLFLLIFAFSPGSVIVHFTLSFKTAVTLEKGLENLRVAISNGTFGDFQAFWVLVSIKSTTSTTPTGTKENTTSSTTTGIKRVRVLNISLFIFGVVYISLQSVLH